MKIWLDDERPAPDDGWSLAKTSKQAIKSIQFGLGYSAILEEVSLDHDLGGEDTGFKVLDWMIENHVWPKVLTIHTSNRPARERMLMAANAEAPEDVEIFVIYDHLDKND